MSFLPTLHGLHAATSLVFSLPPPVAEKVSAGLPAAARLSFVAVAIVSAAAVESVSVAVVASVSVAAAGVSSVVVAVAAELVLASAVSHVESFQSQLVAAFVVVAAAAVSAVAAIVVVVVDAAVAVNGSVAANESGVAAGEFAIADICVAIGSQPMHERDLALLAGGTKRDARVHRCLQLFVVAADAWQLLARELLSLRSE